MHLARSLWEKAGLLPSAFLKTVGGQVSGRRLACCRPSSRSSLLPSSEQLCARLPQHGQETPTSAQAEPSSCSEEVYYPPPSSCVLGCRNTVFRRRHQHRLANARREMLAPHAHTLLAPECASCDSLGLVHAGGGAQFQHENAAKRRSLARPACRPLS